MATHYSYCSYASHPLLHSTCAVSPNHPWLPLPPPPPPPPPPRKQKSLIIQRCIHCSSSSRSTMSSPTRRLTSLALLLLPHFIISLDAKAGGFWDNYVKKKKLEPLEAYVPAVILCQSQLKDLELSLEGDQPKYADCRSLLRSGPAGSLRLNIRAVAEYASEGGQGKFAYDAVDQCLRALEDLDALLLRASRSEPYPSTDSMKAKIEIAVGALESLLQTVPSAVLDKGKAIADAYRTPLEFEEGDVDPDIRELEELL